MFALTLAAAIGSGMMAGVFFVFSVAVMRALTRLPAQEGIAAMQAINLTIVNPLFLVVFIGTAFASAALIVAVFAGWIATRDYVLAGALAYLIGALVVTIVCNIPRNNALAALDPRERSSHALWQQYLREWTVWNHVRTLASIAAAVAFCLALVGA